ncbi:KIR protein [Plasmodium coatneyi]|uniref:KIR protein n=1 Tax=Plasmodium coatneyi TaxID=208452 RepID=A0A1B1DX88_9APIC|nr:KIR protein [Plasmodium coatneyi]ANQ07350.1 KIR protein [Plasmodium coatneyi]
MYKENINMNNGQDWNKLPSQSRYNDLSGCTNCCESSVDGDSVRIVEDSLGSELKQYQGIEGVAHEIVGAYCYACKMKEGTKLNNEWCYWFYYWLGSMALQESGEIFLSKFLSEVYEALEKLEVEHKCEKIGELIDQGTFNQMRTLYEYYKDYDAIQVQLSGSRNRCNEEYEQHLKAILKAYEGAKAKCAAGIYGKYCNGFPDMFTNGQYKNLLDRPCEVVTVPESMEQLSAPSTASIALSTAVSSVFGTLGIGLPTMAFLLYKYNLLPDWINNYFPNSNRSRRKRRSIGRNSGTRIENFTEYSTENNSTIGPTEYSTQGSTADSSDAYTIYDEPLRRTNNTTDRRKNIGYQNM